MPRFLILSLSAYLISLPAFGVTPAVKIVLGKTIVLADVLFVLLVCAVTLAGKERRLPLQRDITGMAGALIAAIAVAALATDAEQAWLEVARTSYSMVVLVVLAHIRLTDEERGWVVGAWLTIALTLASISVLAVAAVILFGLPPNAFVRVGSPNLGPSIARASGLMPPNAFAVYLGLTTALAVHHLARSGGASRRGQAGLLVLVTTGALTVSRGFAGLIVTLAVLAHQRGGVPWLTRRRYALSILAAILVAAAAITMVWAIMPLERRSESVLGVGLNTNPNAYRVLHVTAARMLLARPLLGVGPGEFGARVCDYTTAAERQAAWPPVVCDVDWDPHSLWLGAAAEGGLVVLGAWIGLWTCLLRALLRSGAGPLSLPQVAVAALVGLTLDGLHLDLAHVKFVWAFLGLALAARTRHS